MPVLSENLIAYYECDAAAPASDSWGSNTATLYSISSETGQFNQAWGFSNSYDSVTLSGTPNVGAYTISGWVYNARHTGEAVFSSNGASFTSEWFHMYINGSGELGTLNYSTFTGSGYTVPSLSGWHHFAVTRDASTGNVTFYIDGAQVGATITPSFSGDFSVQIIGSDPGGTDYRWGERLDDYAIWNRTLDASEITTIYNEGNSGNSLRSLIGPSTLRGQFASVVHTVAAENGRLHGQFASIVHTVASENGRLHGMFMSVVHNDAAAGGGGGDELDAIQGQAAQGQASQGVLIPAVQGA
jgi:hypothetical protein